MSQSIGREIAALQRMTPKELQVRYAEIFGEPTKSGNKQQLVKRIAWRLQSLEQGTLSERARRRAEELANDADIRLSPPKPKARTDEDSGRTRTAPLPRFGDERLPPPGSVLTRRYKDQDLRVTVLESGFEHEGEVYRSLSAVAKAITGTHINGYAFFNLVTRKGP